MTNHVVRLYTAAARSSRSSCSGRRSRLTRGPRPSRSRLRIRGSLRSHSARRACSKRAVVVNRVVARRWAIYERRSARRQWQNAVALQRHLQELEASQAAAVRAAQAAVAADRAGSCVRGKCRHLGQPATPGLRRGAPRRRSAAAVPRHTAAPRPRAAQPASSATSHRRRLRRPRRRLRLRPLRRAPRSAPAAPPPAPAPATAPPPAAAPPVAAPVGRSAAAGAGRGAAAGHDDEGRRRSEQPSRATLVDAPADPSILRGDGIDRRADPRR